jgi:alpha-glucosidase
MGHVKNWYRSKEMSNTIKITLVIAMLSVALAVVCPADGAVEFKSPNGKVVAKVCVAKGGRLTFSLDRAGAVVLGASPMGVTVDKTDLGLGVTLGKPAASSIDETYPWRGVKSRAVNRCNIFALPVTHTASKLTWTLEARLFDDGMAYRYIIPGQGERKITAEATAWMLPKDCHVWYQTNTDNYEGPFSRKAPADIPQTKTVEQKTSPADMGPPITIELADGTHAAITEANVQGYSGMSIKPTGSCLVQAAFTDDQKGWTMTGKIKTPWRVVMTGPGLNDLVNCDIVHNVCPPPDKKLFPKGINTEWIKPGRCLWQWWAYDDPGTMWDKQKWFVDQAAKLKCQYYLVDAGWENPKFGWVDPKTGHSWAKMKELVDYAATKGVGIFVWRTWETTEQGPGLKTPEIRKEFFANCRKYGVKCAKIDYMDNESKSMLEFYFDCTRRAAENKIMINFHGANKPAGEARTWPNEITREGIMGLEHNKWSVLKPSHYSVLLFTRMLAGHGDFTPTTFQPEFLKGTTASLQLAMAVAHTSPILCWADKPEVYLAHPTLELVQTVPAVWDETRVLGGSKIGELAVLARRSGKDWWVGIINGSADKARKYKLDLSFLGDGEYSAVYCRDKTGSPADVIIEKTKAKASATLDINMAPGGGFVARFVK